MTPIIAPSILSADFGMLKSEIEMINQSQADWFHVDVMDGVFVPNISFGFPVMSSLQKWAQKPLDVHLMIIEPQRYIKQFADHGTAIITVHYEACLHLHSVIQSIKDCGCKAGVAINPHTPVAHLESILAEIDLVLIMSVNPGFGGQAFISNSLNKITQLNQLRSQLNPKLLIEVDGGVSLINKDLLLQSGADALVAGSAIFKSDNPTLTISNFKSNVFPSLNI